MTELLQELERKLAKLPEEEQEQWLSHFLKELSLEAFETNGDAADEDEGEWIGSRRPTQEEISEAIEQLTQFSKGRILGKDVTIKDLINEGRRY
jgi:hypothetical protein